MKPKRVADSLQSSEWSCAVYTVQMSVIHYRKVHLSSDDVFWQRLNSQAAKRLATDDFIIGSMHHRA